MINKADRKAADRICVFLGLDGIDIEIACIIADEREQTQKLKNEAAHREGRNIMKLEDAIEIVIGLANFGMIGEEEALSDPEVLVPDRKKQKEALDTVCDFFTNNVFD